TSSRGTGFLAAIERHTPDLLAEVRGIADGSNVAFDRTLALNLMDEEWWLTAPAEPRNACTLIAVGPREGRPSSPRTWTCPRSWTAPRRSCASTTGTATAARSSRPPG